MRLINKLAYRALRIVPRKLLAWISWIPAAKFRSGVVVIAHNDFGEVLLVQHAYRSPKYWELPGGLMGRHETVAQAATREIEEETNLRITDVHVIGVDTYMSPPTLDIFVCAKVESTQWKLGPEIHQLCFAASPRDLVSEEEWSAMRRHLLNHNPSKLIIE